MDPIVESEMTFGPYPDGHCFRIEDSEVHKAAGEGVKIVEFLKLELPVGKAAQVWLVEAKRSAPRTNLEYQNFIQRIRDEGHVRFPGSPPTLNEYVDFVRDEGRNSFAGPANDFEDYFNEIREKMVNGLTLYFTARLNRHKTNDGEWPEPFRDLDLGTTGFRLFLVIKTAEESWLPPLSEKFKKVMRPTAATWALGPNAVEVLSEAGAQKHGLIAKE